MHPAAGRTITAREQTLSLPLAVDMLKWKYERTEQSGTDGEDQEQLASTATSSDVSVTSSNITPSQRRINKILQAYEDYRVKLLSDLDNISIRSLCSQTEEILAKQTPPATASAGQEQTTPKIKQEKATPMANSKCDVDNRNEMTGCEHTSMEQTGHAPSTGHLTSNENRRISPNDCQEFPDDVPRPVPARRRVAASNHSTENWACANVEQTIPTLTKAIEEVANKNAQPLDLSNVLQMISSLKVEFNSMRNQLVTSAKSQHKLEQEVGSLKTERSNLLETLISGQTTSSVSESSTGSGRHCRSQFNLLKSADGRKRAGYASADAALGGASPERESANPLMSSFIANLPSPRVRKRSDNFHYTDSETSCSSSAHREAGLSQFVRESPARKCQPSRAEARHSLPNYRSQSMSLFDLRGGGSRDGRRQLFNFQLTHKLSLLKELVESQRRHCADLWQLTQNYSRLLASTGALSHKDVIRVFPGLLSAMYEQHCALLRSLHKRVLSWKQNNGRYGNVLARITNNRTTDMFAMYKDYIDKFPLSVKILNKTSRNSSIFRKVLRRSKQQGGAIGNVQELLQLLVGPIKMLQLYLEFLKEALYNTDGDHPDKFYLQTSCDRLQNFLRSRNKAVNVCMQMTGVCMASLKAQRYVGRTQASPVYHHHILDRVPREGWRKTTLNIDSGIDSLSESVGARGQMSGRAKAATLSSRQRSRSPRQPHQYSNSMAAQSSDHRAAARPVHNVRPQEPAYDSEDYEIPLPSPISRTVGTSQQSAQKGSGKRVLADAGDYSEVQSSQTSIDTASTGQCSHDALRKLGHSMTHQIGPHPGSDGSSVRTKVRFRIPSAEAGTLRELPSRTSGSKKKSLTDKIKGAQWPSGAASD